VVKFVANDNGGICVIPSDRGSPYRSRLCLYLYLLLMGCVASQLYTHISLQCRSNLFLKALTDVASITVCGSLFHSFTMRRLKKCCLTVVRHLGLNSFMECPRKPVVTSAGKSSESVQCAIIGPCLRIRHRLSA